MSGDIRVLSQASLRNLARLRGEPIPNLNDLPRVLPLGVFVAGRDRFEFLVRGFANLIEAKILVFRHVPLEEHGWERDDCRIRHVRNEPKGMIFVIERT